MDNLLRRRAGENIDYNEYRRLEEKREKVLLKKMLYDHKRASEEKQVADLIKRLERE